MAGVSYGRLIRSSILTIRGIVKLRRSAQTGVYENQRAQLSRIPISA
jgi:hypothetical protein